MTTDTTTCNHHRPSRPASGIPKSLCGVRCPKDLGPFRLTCRDLYDHTSDAFTRSLNARQWDITDVSKIRALEQLARHPQLGHRVKTICIDPKFVGKTGLKYLKSRALNPFPPGSGTSIDWPENANATHMANAMVALTRLRHIEIGNLPGLQPAASPSGAVMLTRLFIDMLYSIASASLRLESLSAVHYCTNYGNPLLMCVNLPLLPEIHEEMPLGNALRRAFATLKVLRLGLDSFCRRGQTVPEQWLSRFLTLMPALQERYIWCYETAPLAASDGTLHHLLERPRSWTWRVLRSFCAATLPTLRRFELSNAVVPATDLMQWLRNHVAGLTYLSLRRVSLRNELSDRSWNDILDSINQHASAFLAARLSCLYEPSGEAVSFDQTNMSLRGDHGNHTQGIPLVHGWACLAPTKYADDLREPNVLDKERWPLNFEKASGVEDTPDVVTWEQSRPTVELRTGALDASKKPPEEHVSLADVPSNSGSPSDLKCLAVCYTKGGLEGRLKERVNEYHDHLQFAMSTTTIQAFPFHRSVAAL
ncbi:uncharacterized protein LTR77_000115 [Saxophila tyrrhenica]|uniref:Uncharacterized protein n=1 Tax=Saxophila tyrrhenica TaxID=1690608 RepID=A0AAV9PLT0_9PEZI|nr:hypothetical protein LTR77_000115 [Saxophila tyrrhenica]